jgi:hypothetical protein
LTGGDPKVILQMDGNDADPRFSELTLALKHALQHQNFEAGKLLADVLNAKHYGEWKTFDAFVKGELGISPKHAYRLIFAYGIREFLKTHDRLSPDSEKSVRPLSQLRVDNPRNSGKLNLEELQLRAWDIAVGMKQRSRPTETDVRRAVQQLMAEW